MFLKKNKLVIIKKKIKSNNLLMQLKPVLIKICNVYECTHIGPQGKRVTYTIWALNMNLTALLVYSKEFLLEEKRK